MARRSTYLYQRANVITRSGSIRKRRKKGITSHDEIWLATGKEKGKALVTPGIRPTRFCLYGIWRQS